MTSALGGLDRTAMASDGNRKPPTGAANPESHRDDRLAEALRANLHRRKAAARRESGDEGERARPGDAPGGQNRSGDATQ
ncbi:MAG: hypothetical protein AAFX08_03750 [Pseudomonadota bacterium]